VVVTIGASYRRYGPDSWFVSIGESEEPVFDCNDLEAAFQAACKARGYDPDGTTSKRIAELEQQLTDMTAHRNRLIESSMEAWARIDDQ
jgi:hypothetical protein